MDASDPMILAEILGFAPSLTPRTGCPFCPGMKSGAPYGALCNLCRRDLAMRGVEL